jgi:hypothetical protein
MAKNRLIFDTTDANTMSETDSVGAYVRSDDGTLITHHNIASGDHLDVFSALADGAGTALTSTLVSGDQALDVNMVNAISIDVDGVYNGATNLNPDNVGSIYHTRAAAIGDTQQIERTTAGAVATIASANLSDINAIDTNSFLYAIDDSNGNAEPLERDNTSGGLNVHFAGQDNDFNVSDAALANTAIANAVNTLAVASTAEDVVAAPLANRKYLFIYNNDNRTMFIGATGVTAADGFPVDPGSVIEMRAGAAVDIEWVSPKVSHDMRTLELS